ncbi:hypothetical protein PVAG01_05350 [Phlyctema vagabunda]|uniref:Mitotic checkpoint regulator, MAD2B-interacting-domain-containing protein n=1 Tax=Phlyctema vagabunda TaxID=108571 RepID=A0ABR4PJU4_9HELO
MGLVDYSDSEGSEEETPAPAPVPAPKTTAAGSKPTFQKVVDRANPGKIRVSLPQISAPSATKEDGPPAKRAKTGGGAFGGFNSFLPAPKRAGASSNATLGGGQASRKGGLGAGVNLKTGAAPGFSREPEPEREYTAREDEDAPSSGGAGSGLSLPPPKSSLGSVDQKPAEEVKLVGKPLMFRPLSVARKTTKKKKTTVGSTSIPTANPAQPTMPQTTTEEKAAPRPKVSLFSMDDEVPSTTVPATSGEYEPLMYEPDTEAGAGAGAGQDGHESGYANYESAGSQYSAAAPTVPDPSQSQSLADIAGDLNLSAAERRQLFGRQKGGAQGQQSHFSATKVINFNTDKEYQHNEELRAAGEQVVHNPVRAIAPGKHSLKQLVNAAQSQKDALEESFAKGKSNRAEASSRYGW